MYFKSVHVSFYYVQLILYHDEDGIRYTCISVVKCVTVHIDSREKDMYMQLLFVLLIEKHNSCELL